MTSLTDLQDLNPTFQNLHSTKISKVHIFKTRKFVCKSFMFSNKIAKELKMYFAINWVPKFCPQF